MLYMYYFTLFYLKIFAFIELYLRLIKFKEILILVITLLDVLNGTDTRQSKIACLDFS